MAINLPGVDEGVFQDLMDGDEELFATVLSTFIEKTPGSLAKLANPTKETLADYAILVHGVKGACANICAEELRQKALKLEQLSKAGDLDGVLAWNGRFIKEMEEMAERAANWMKSRK